MKRIFFIITLFLCVLSNYGQTTINAMFYNLLNYPTAPPQNRDVILKDILNTYEPDIFMVCELESETASNNIVDFSLSEINKNYLQAQFTSNQSDTSDYSNLQQLLFYNSDYFILDNQQVITTNIRDINHYTLLLKTFDYQTNPVYLEVFVTHLKASQGTVEEQKRLEMITEFTNSLNSLSSDSYVVLAGDFNFYTSSEDGYQKILDTNNHVIIKDVLNMSNSLQSWHTNYNYQTLHTQATRLSNTPFNGYGAGGGLDDRFDFIMLSENIINPSYINYVANSYKSYGNNGNCYNKRIDDTDCLGDFSQTLRDNLYNMSDHLPVVLSLETTQTLSTANNTTNKNSYFVNGNSIDTELILEFPSDKYQNKRLIIYNNLGQIVYENLIQKTKMHIDTSSFSKGLYYLKIEDVNDVLKFVKI